MTIIRQHLDQEYKKRRPTGHEPIQKSFCDFGNPVVRMLLVTRSKTFMRHDRIESVQAMQRQLSELQVAPKEIPTAASAVQLAFMEESRIAEAVLSSPSTTFTGVSRSCET